MRVRGEIWALVVLLAVGALLRGLYLSELVSSPGFSTPQVDAGYHDYWARALVTDNWNLPPQTHDPQIRTTPFFRPPGYPYFLSLVYRLTGGSHQAARIVQMALGLLSALLAFFIGCRWFGSRMGLVFAGLFATYWGFIYFEGDLLEPPLFTALGLLLVWSLGLSTHKITLARASGTGLILGLSALVRPTSLLLIPVILIWAFWVLRNRRQFFTATVGILLATGLTISPATIRNYWVANDVVLISSNAGINLLMGNHAQANGTISPTVPGLGELGTSYDYPRLVRALEATMGRSLKHSEVSAYLGNEAWKYIQAHPLDTVKLTWKKALLFWGPREVGNNKEDELERANSRILRWIPGNFATSSALFIVGLLVFFLRWRKEDAERRQVGLLVLLLIATYFVAYLPYFAAGRFRMPVVPFLLFFGAIFLDQMIAWAKARRWQTVALWFVGVLATYAVTSQNFAGYEPTRDKWHFDRGLNLARAGQVDAAIREYQAALAIDPNQAQVHFNLGALLEFKGQVDEAVPFMERAIVLDPHYSLAHHALATILAGRGKMDEAATHFQSALASDPSPTMYVDYGDFLVRQRKDAEALKAYQSALLLHPGHVPAHNNLAILLFLQGDYAGAWREVELCRRYGGNPPEAFLQALRQKLSK